MQRVASLTQLPRDRGLRVEIDGQKILLVRDGDAVRAYSAECPHAGAPLDEGAVCEGLIVCPWHKAAFRVSDGALVEPPALDRLSRFPVRVDGDDIFVGAHAEPQAQQKPLPDKRTFALIGAGAAGATAAAALREYGFGGRILLMGAEPKLPYDRTSLSKFVLGGQMKPEETPLLRTAEFFRDNDVEIIEARVTRLDVAKREVVLADGRRLAFDSALVAPGGEPRTPDIPGVDKRGVHKLRSLEEADAILADIRPGANAVILGASFIGLEAASCLRAQKVNVAVVSPESVPLARQFGERVGGSLRALHETNGVTFYLNAKAVRIEGGDRVRELVLEDGRRLPADLVVVGVGVRPATGFVEGLKLREDGGLPVDASLRAADGVYAAGDVAAFPLPPDGKLTRIEHWRVAQQQARLAAANMLGANRGFECVPFFWTYHYGQNYDYLGHAEHWDEEIVVGDVAARNFIALFLQSGRVAAAVACQRQRLTAALAVRMRAPLMRDEVLRWVEA